jgi:DNA-binding winged helix-turn-helix (wHTH) protein
MQIRFGAFTLDLDARQLTREGHAIHLEPKAFELLATLIADRPKVVSKAELQKRLWPDTFVAEANLSNLVAEIRATLGDQARAPSFIRTAHGFGYAFSGEASVVPSGSPAPARHQPLGWLEWGAQRFPLPAGEHIIGRDPDLAINLDHSTVSRRHARVTVGIDGALLEDFGSKNGTYRCGVRVTSPTALADGDTIHIGSLLVTFHTRAYAMSTDTMTRPVP